MGAPGRARHFPCMTYRSRSRRGYTLLEVTAALRPEGPFRGDLAWTWTDSEVEDAGFATGPDASFVEGEPLLRRPAHRITAAAAWTPGDGRTVRLEGAWVGERDDRDFTALPPRRIALDDYLRMDLSARWPLLEGGEGRSSLAATLRVDNLLDEDYQEVFNFPARGRSVFVGAEAALGL